MKTNNTIKVNCSELRLYYMNKEWWLKQILGQSVPNRKGLIKHNAIIRELNEAEKSELSYRDVQEIKRVHERVERHGEIRKAHFASRGVLQGIADGFINNIPIEIKFSKKREEDRLQAQGYCYIYNSPYAFLIYPQETIKVTLDDVFELRVQEVYREKTKIIGGCCDGTC